MQKTTSKFEIVKGQVWISKLSTPEWIKTLTIEDMNETNYYVLEKESYLGNNYSYGPHYSTKDKFYKRRTNFLAVLLENEFILDLASTLENMVKESDGQTIIPSLKS